jgi:hypothetical protein
VKVLEPHYELPSRAHFSKPVVPALYKQAKATVVNDLANAPRVELTTDGWTYRELLKRKESPILNVVLFCASLSNVLSVSGIISYVSELLSFKQAVNWPV